MKPTWIQATLIQLPVFVVLGFGSIAQAQDALEAEKTKPSVWVEPRVTAGITISNNGGLANLNVQGEQIIEISPGLRMVMKTPRVTGFLDYSLTSLFVAQDTAGNNIRHYLNADATVQVWDNRLFLDLSGVVEDQAVSAFGTPGVGSWADVNKSETATFGFSPYLKGRWADFADYELRYQILSTTTEDATISDVLLHGASFRASSPAAGQKYGWAVNASTQVVDYSLGRKTSAGAVEGNLMYRVTPQLRATLTAGFERNDFITVDPKGYTNTGLALEWRPSERTKLVAGVERRYFGSGHNIGLEHRTGHTIWRYIDTRAASNDELGTGAASLGSVYDLLDALYTTTEPDPILRARLVQSELLKLGLAANTQVFQEFLTSAATLRRFQQFSVAWVGLRDAVTLSLSRVNSQRLDTVVALAGLGDDFDVNTKVKQLVWAVDYGHRLTPLTSLSLTYSSQKNVGDGAGQDTQLHSLAAGLTTRLGRRTDGRLQLRHTISNGTADPYKETSIAGFVTHRF